MNSYTPTQAFHDGYRSARSGTPALSSIALAGAYLAVTVKALQRPPSQRLPGETVERLAYLAGMVAGFAARPSVLAYSLS